MCAAASYSNTWRADDPRTWCALHRARSLSTCQHVPGSQPGPTAVAQPSTLMQQPLASCWRTAEILPAEAALRPGREAGNTRVNVSVLYGTAPPLSERLSAQLFQQVSCPVTL